MSRDRASDPLRLGTRRSPLALAQSGRVARALETAHPGLAVELVPIVTRGDRLKGDLAPLGGKGLFTAELERGLARGELDLAVHSLKDLPVHPVDGLTIAAHPERADPRDVLVSELAPDLDALPAGTVLLTGSLRRRAQILARRSDLAVEPIRGNVDTRLRKWRARAGDGGAVGLILAAAGLARLGLIDLPAHPLDPAVMVPAPGQGILALQTRAGSRAEELCRALDHPPAARAARAERRVVAELGGDCTLPLAAWATIDERRGVGGETFRLRAVLATPDGELVARGEAEGGDPDSVAEACLEALRRDGSEAVLAALGTA